MKTILASVFLVQMLLVVGCSNEEGALENEPAGLEEQAGGSPQQGGAPGVSTALNAIGADLKAQKYEEVTAGLAILKNVPKSPEQEQEYKRTVFEAQEVLRMQAEQNAEARRAYERFGQMMTGR